MPVGILNLGEKVVAPSSTSNKLYNISGNLIWNGNNLIHSSNLSNINTVGTISNGIWSSSIQLSDNKITNNGGTKGISIQDTTGKVLINNTNQGDSYTSILTLYGDTNNDEGIIFGKTHNTTNPKALYTTFGNNTKSIKTQYCYTTDGAQYDFQLITNNTLSNTTNKYFRIRQLTSTNTDSTGENSDYGFYLGSGCNEHTQSVYGYINILPQTQNTHSIWTGTHNSKNYADYINIDNNHTCYLFMKQGLTDTYSGTEYTNISGWGLGVGKNNTNNNFVIAKWKSDDNNLHYGSGNNSWQIPALLIDDNNKIGIGTTNPLSSLHLQKTDAIIIPKGTTAERPTNSTQGMLRYNTTDTSFEGYNGNEWGAIGGGSSDSSGIQKGPILEVLCSVCDGSTVTVPSGTYTFQNVTTSQNSTVSYQTINGSLMYYKPPAGTTHVIYEYIYYTDTEGQMELVHTKLFIDNTEVINARSNSSNYGHNYGNRRVTKWIFQCNAAANNTDKGYFTSWDNLKEIKVTARSHSSTYQPKFHETHYWDTGLVDNLSQPILKITAIRDNPYIQSGVSEPSKGMIIQLQHKDYTAQQTKDNTSWDAIDNRIDGNGYVVSIKPTNANSNVFVTCNCHIGIYQAGDARWYGLRLYRKIGSGNWEHITGAGGTTSGPGTECWLADNMGVASGAAEGDSMISNLGNSFLDSPNTTETVYYTIYWKSRLGENPGNDLIYFNRAHNQNDAYRSKPISTITAQEIWNLGTPYVPPSNNITITGDDDVLISGTGGFQVPVGTTAEQPTTSTQGMLRYNTTDSIFEGYDGSSWSAIGAIQPGDTIETLTSQCDGSSVTVKSGSYTFENVTTYYTTPTTFHTSIGASAHISGSLMNYTPPILTTRVEYSFTFMIHRSNLTKPLIHMALYIDNVQIASSRMTAGQINEYGSQITIDFVINCSAANLNVNKGHYTSWTTPKRLEVRCRSYSAAYEGYLHWNRWWNGASNNDASLITVPKLEIKAIA